MTSLLDLPKTYRMTDYINLHADKKRYRLLNALSFLIGAVLLFLGWLWQSFGALSELLSKGFGAYYLWLGLLLVGILLALSLHQLVHGLFMRLFSCLPTHYGRKGLFLSYAASDAFFCRGHYLMIALAPVVLIGIMLAVLTVLTHGMWFWLFYGLQILNIGSAVGDYALFIRALRAPKTALFQDDGIGLAVYTEESE